MKILIIHGPNMNLLGLRSASKGKKVTLDKVNRHIRRYIRDKGIEIKIIQAHDENKVVSYLHRNRNKFEGMILTPGAWGQSAFILEETIELISLDYISIVLDKTQKINILKGKKTIYNSDIYLSFETAINNYIN